MRDVAQQQLDFMDSELPRFLRSGAWEPGERSIWVSRIFLVPKPGESKWRLIIDLRPMNKVLQGLQTHVRDTQAPQEPDACRRLDGLLRPRGRPLHTGHTGTWHRLLYGKLSRHAVPSSRSFNGLEMQHLLFLPAYRSFYPSFTRTAAQPHRAHPRTSTNQQPTRPKPPRRYLRSSRWRGARLLPYMDDLLFFADNKDEALQLRDRVASLPTRPPQTMTQPQERSMGACTNLRAPRTPNRHHNLYFPSSSFETTSHCYPLPDPTATLYTRRPLATCPTARNARRKRKIAHPTVTKDSNKIQGTTKVLLNLETWMGR
jgi:hypothetical protein